MDFALDEAQQAVADLADQILADCLDMELLLGIEERGAWFDADLWASLATAGAAAGGSEGPRDARQPNHTEPLPPRERDAGAVAGRVDGCGARVSCGVF